MDDGSRPPWLPAGSATPAQVQGRSASPAPPRSRRRVQFLRGLGLGLLSWPFLFSVFLVLALVPGGGDPSELSIVGNLVLLFGFVTAVWLTATRSRRWVGIGMLSGLLIGLAGWVGLITPVINH